MTGEDWRQLLSEASQLRGAGHVPQAIAAYRRLLSAKPDLPDSWYNLGWLQRQARQFEDALNSYSRALELNVSEPEEVHVNRAAIYSDHLHRPNEAERELGEALTKNPRYVPALLNLGNLQEDLGNREAARAAYEQVLQANPRHELALARLAGVSHSANLDLSLAERLTTAIAGAAPAERADLGFALAGLLDAAGQFDRAFDAASRANAASKAATGARYDRKAHEQFVDRLIGAFDRPVLRSAENEIAPIFICGMFRSGSTLVEQILASHSRVTSCGELDLLPAIAARIAGYPEAVISADDAMIAGWRSAYLGGLPARPAAGHLVTDKRPDNFLHIGLIKTLFPGARIIHTHRNPLDNLLSLYFLHLDPGMAYALDLEDAAHWYGEYKRLMAHWKRLYPADICDVDYDDLVLEPQPAVEQMLRCCGLQWEDGLLEFHRRRSAVKTASVWQVRQPLHVRSSGRWRNYRGQLKSLAALGEGGEV